MKSLTKLIRRYSLTAGLFIALILMVNLGVLIFLGNQNVQRRTGNPSLKTHTQEIVRQFTVTEQGPALSAGGYQALEQSPFCWAMALDEAGRVIWEWQFPSSLPRSYTVSDAAVFTRWYLRDYPVKVWNYHGYLLVFGLPKGSLAKYTVEFSEEELHALPGILMLFLSLNLLLILLFVLGFGYRFNRSLLPLGEGIDRLSENRPVRLKEKGPACELAKKLNHAAALLEEQNRRLQKRDQARVQWISGVSHDIRTPLALILGYSHALSQAPGLSSGQRQQASAICSQSLVIRQLIEDLNLISKLTWQARPLRQEPFSPALLLRECAAEFYNNGLDERFCLQVLIPKEAEQIKLSGDPGLWMRALRNLLGNSIRHNPDGCRITAMLIRKNSRVWYEISDSGTGIPEEIVRLLKREDFDLPSGSPHIMGLRLAKQIAVAHGGSLWFRKRDSKTYDTVLVLKQ